MPGSDRRRSRAARPAAIRIAGLAFLWAAGCFRNTDAPGSAPAVAAGGGFVDRAAELGVAGAVATGSPDQLWIFENLGSGCALLDYDGDGRLDIFINNAGTTRVEPGPPRRVILQPGPGPHLYRQLADAPAGKLGRFQETTRSAGIDFTGWGTGTAVGDVDNDGNLDLFVGAFGASELYGNQGDGKFIRRTREARLDAAAGMASSAVFFDYDRDGFLDLYIARYVEFDPLQPPNDGKPCFEKELAISCGPTMHQASPDLLFRNQGNGTFIDSTARAGMSDQPGSYGLGVAAGDFDRDGWPDVYVANDTTANYLWHNRGDGTFQEKAVYCGAALSDNGQGQAGMGVDAADANGDGWLDLGVTNYAEEPNSYYQNLRDGTFNDRSAVSGIGGPSYLALGWGIRFFDFDQDGALDIAVANGHVHPRAAELNPALTFPQRMLLFKGDGRGSFEEIAAGGRQAGALSLPRNHRGLATGDIDGDADIDMVVTLLDGPPLLLENRWAPAGNSISFRLRGTTSNREGIGARVEITAAGKTMAREATRGGSYLSSSDALVHFGIGAATVVERAEIVWPSGKITRLENLPAGNTHRIEEK